MDHADLVAALQQPDAYPHPVRGVRLIQTHISSVFLTGDRVYKLKKPVNFGFLDFSTCALRERFCRAEVDLNRRLAPDVYLGVEPVVEVDGRVRIGGAGTPLDWVVVMRQLDERILGTEVLARGELGPDHVDRLVELLVPFYRDARTGAGVDQFGSVAAVRVNTDENFSQTEAYVGKLLSRERFEHIRAWTHRFFDDHAEVFDRRIREGRIRDSHGDLHLRNIFFERPPVVFDCIEFNDRFRCGDIAVDLAFLAMDLDFNDRPELAHRLIDGYVAASGDVELPALLDFYRCYRAYVRGKIACFTSADPSLDDKVHRTQRNLARRYFGLAYRYAGGTERPPLIVLYGLMGSGKTSVARWLREEYGWHMVSTDAVRKQLAGVGENTRVWVPYNEGLYSPEMNRRTYEEVCRRAENLLLAGFPVVIDGAFKSRDDRAPVIELAARADARMLFVRTECSPEEQVRRLAGRQQYDTRSDGRVEIMEQQRGDFEPPDAAEQELHVVLDTSGQVDRTRAALREILELNGHKPQPAVAADAGNS